MKGKMESGGMCKCPCHGVGKSAAGVGVLLLGLVFLAKNRGWMGAGLADTLWPLVLVLYGVLCVGKKLCKCCGSGACP